MMFSRSSLPSYQLTSSREMSYQPSAIERLHFKMHTPNPQLSDLNKNFCLIVDEVDPSPGLAPLKWAVRGFFKSDAPIYKIQFYALDPLTDERKDLIARIEWKVVGSPKEIHLKEGSITFPKLSLNGNRLSQFIVKQDQVDQEEVLVGYFGGYQTFENAVRRQGVGEYHYSAEHIHEGVKVPRTGDIASYTVGVDLKKESHTDYEGRVEMCSIPHPFGTLPIESPLLAPLMVYLVLVALERDRDNLMIYKTSAGYVTAPLTSRAQRVN